MGSINSVLHSSKTLRRVCFATSAVLGNADHIGFAGEVMDVRVVDAIENCFYRNGSLAAARPF
jgi:hypothetical protein